MHNNLISIIIPVKNGSNYLKEAIDGINKQNMNVEIIVVDDGSTDNTFELAKSLGCKIIRNAKSEGPVKAKNKAIIASNGNYIMFHDHDDVVNPDSLRVMFEELQADETLSAVMCKVKDFVSPEIPEEEKQKTVVKPEPYYGLFTGAILMRREIFDKIGLFDESVTAGEIIDWQTKMDKHNLKIKKLDLVSTNRRLHTSNFGKTGQKKEFKDYASLLRSKLKGISNMKTSKRNTAETLVAVEREREREREREKPL